MQDPTPQRPRLRVVDSTEIHAWQSRGAQLKRRKQLAATEPASHQERRDRTLTATLEEATGLGADDEIERCLGRLRGMDVRAEFREAVRVGRR